MKNLHSSKSNVPVVRAHASIKRFPLITLLLLIVMQGLGQTNTYTGSSGGNWNTGGNWSLGVPTAAHDVVIPSNRNVTVNTAGVCKSLTISSGTSSNTITISGSNSLTVSEAVNIQQPTSNSRTKEINVGNGTLTAGSIVMTATSAASRVVRISVNGGTVNVDGNITMGNNNEFRFTGSGLLNIGGNISGGTLTPGTGTVNYNGAGAQIISGANTHTFYNLTINKPTTAATVSSNNHAFTVNNNLTITRGTLHLNATDDNYLVTNNISIAAQGVLSHNVNWDTDPLLLRVNGNISVDGRITYTVRSHIQMGGTGTKYVRTGANASSAFSILTLQNGNFYADGTVRVNDNFWAMFGTAGSFRTNGETLHAQGAVLISGGTFFVDGGTANISGGLHAGVGGMNGAVNISSGTLNTDNFNVGNGTNTGSVAHSGGTVNISNDLYIRSSCVYTCTNSPAININGNWITDNNNGFAPGGSTVTFQSAGNNNITGTATSQTFNHINLNKAGGTLSVAGSLNTITANGNLTLSQGTWDAGTMTTMNVYGNWTNNSVFNAGSSRVFMRGTAAQQISGSTVTVFNGLTINNSNHVNLNGVDVEVTGGTGGLTFINGKLITAAHEVVLDANTTINNVNANRYVQGNLRMGINTSTTSRAFAIGDATSYTPVTLTFTGITSGGSVLMFTTGSEHPNILTSSLVENLSVNRYYTLSNSGVAFTSYFAVFNFVASDVDAGANTSAFIVGRYDAGAWSYPALGARTSTSTRANGLTGFGTFAIAEGDALPPTVSTPPADFSGCVGTSTSVSVEFYSKLTTAVQWQLSTNGGGSWNNVPAGAPYSVITTQNGGDVESELTINPVAGGMGNYRYRAIASNSRGNITSAGAILTLATLPTSNPGAPLTAICGNTATAPLGGSVTNATGGLWSSDAGGTFSPSANDLNATWTPPLGYSGTATLTLTTVGGCTSIASNKTQVVHPAPATVLIPASVSVCEGAIESLSVSNTVTTEFASGNVNLAIPNFSTAGVTNSMAVSGIPAGAIIKNITVTFNVTHPEVADLMMNIKAPNGNVLNLANRPNAGPGTNFTNTRVSATGSLTFASSSSPFNNIYAPMAALNVGASGNLSNVTSFNSLMSTMNGNWIISARDAAASNSGTLNNWTLTIEWIEPTTWSPIANLYTNPEATIAYAGQSVETVYFKGNTVGSVDYTVTQTGTNGCVTSTIIPTVVNEVPEITIYKDYCAVPGQVVLTAQTDIPVASYLWNTGATTQSMNADIALPYQVIVTTAAGCKDTANASVGIELIQNGNFESGNTGFTSNYTYVSNATQNGLFPEERYTVSNSPNYMHSNFWGADHTSGTGMMMIVNGSGSNPPINVWQQTVAVTPNTDYYFSAWAISMNSAAPFANLQFKVNGTQVGTTTGALPPRANNNNPPFDWVRFYGTWNSGSATSAVVSIIDLEQAAGGNDFAIDDISFGTINPFINLTTPGTDTQSVCINSPILDIEYEVGGEDTGPAIVGLPPGVTSVFNGNSVIISGTPTVAGVYNFSLSSTGACANVTRYGQITVNQRTIILTSAVDTDNQLTCIFTPITNITYAIGGSATGATVSGLPAGVSGIYNAGVVTISGSPIVTGTFNYTVTTTGTCEALIAQGTIEVTRQTLTLTSANDAQTVCVNASIANIVYEVGGSATGAGVVGLPPGVIGTYNAGIFTISGTPTLAGTYNYTVTTTGTCNHRIENGVITVGQSVGGNVASVSLCSNGSGNLSLSGHNGNVIRWESSNDGNNWTPIVNTTATQSYNFTGSTLYYRAVVQYSTCDPVNSNTATVALSNYWTGAVSNDWQNPANWADGNVPSTVCPDVIIPVVTTVYPSLNSGMATVNNLNVYPGAVLEISGGLLQIAGTITASGNIDASGGTIEMNGTSVVQQVSGSYFLNNELGGLIVSNAHDVNITGADTLKIMDEVSFGVSNAVLNVNNNLTLVSNENRTARVGDITNGGTLSGTNILGNVTVERYIPEHSKAWQFLSVPTKGSTIQSSWMEGNAPMGNLRPGRGTLVTGQVANAVAQGFDLRTPAGATVKVYNSNTNVFDGVTSALTPMANMKGYMLLVRGDRSVTTSTAPATATTLRTTGQLYTLGAEAPPVVNVAAGKYEAVGNPYPSAISFDQLNRTGGIADMYYLWDPLLTNGGSAYGLGGFQTFTRVGMNYVVTPGGGSYTGGNTNIESGSAFLVYAPTTAGSITFTETAKVDGSNTVNRNSLLPEYFRTQLYAHNNGTPVLLDGVMNVFDIHSSNGVDENDAPKMTNTGENLGIKRDGSILAVESRLPLADSDTIQYNLTQLRVLTYQMVFIPNNTDYPDMQAFFEDTYMNTSTPVSLTDTTRITFNVVNIPGSYAPNRFRLVFKSLAVLPVTFTSISANATIQNDVDVVWRVEDEVNMEKYELEKSADGRNFSFLASFNPTAPNSGAATYRYNDVKPGAGNWYYRVKGISTNGLVQYSAIARATIDLSVTGISVHPVPVENKTIMIHFEQMEPDRYQAVLTNSAGQIVHRSVFKTDAPNQVISIKLNDVPRGMYYLQLKGMVTYTRKLIIN